MSEMGEIVELFRKQMEVQQQQIEEQRKQIEKLLSFLGPVSATPPAVASSVPSFPAFDPTSELWKEYWARFKTFAGANSIPAEKLAQVFLTNQTTTTFKLLSTLAFQQGTRQLTPGPTDSQLKLALRRFDWLRPNRRPA
uniref:Uncharacterized protein n=1 Tax=Trichuris muris TaxID=70415 RepID=A0A5S6Q4R9_TRIMR